MVFSICYGENLKTFIRNLENFECVSTVNPLTNLKCNLTHSGGLQRNHPERFRLQIAEMLHIGLDPGIKTQWKSPHWKLSFYLFCITASNGILVIGLKWENGFHISDRKCIFIKTSVWQSIMSPAELPDNQPAQLLILMPFIFRWTYPKTAQYWWFCHSLSVYKKTFT